MQRQLKAVVSESSESSLYLPSEVWSLIFVLRRLLRFYSIYEQCWSDIPAVCFLRGKYNLDYELRICRVCFFSRDERWCFDDDLYDNNARMNLCFLVSYGGGKWMKLIHLEINLRSFTEIKFDDNGNALGFIYGVSDFYTSLEKHYLLDRLKKLTFTRLHSLINLLSYGATNIGEDNL
jgi:hypothetical protein